MTDELYSVLRKFGAKTDGYTQNHDDEWGRYKYLSFCQSGIYVLYIESAL